MSRVATMAMASLLVAGCTVNLQTPTPSGPTKPTSSTAPNGPASPRPTGGKRGFLADQPLMKRTTLTHCLRPINETPGPFSPCSSETVVQLDGTYTYRSGNDPVATGTVPAAELTGLKAALENLDVARVLKKEQERCTLMDAELTYVFNAQGATLTLHECVFLQEPAAKDLQAAMAAAVGAIVKQRTPAADPPASETL